MLIAKIDDVVGVSREVNALIARFERPMLVSSTSPINGGLRDDYTAVYNVQSCEARVHHELIGAYLSTHQDEEHELLCREHGLDPVHTAGMATAANMSCAGVSLQSFRDLQVLAVITGGVAGNAARAGDSASFFEWDGQFNQVSEPEQPKIGTINTMVFYSHTLKPGTLIRALMMATEAKGTVLDQLVVGSKFSSGKATGTGTDQFMAACPIDRGVPFASLGHHNKLGELTALAVRDALRQALEVQNALTPTSRAVLSVQLARFGFAENDLFALADAELSASQAQLFKENFWAIDHDPLVVSAAASIATNLDQLASGVLPAGMQVQILDRQARLLASAASGLVAELGELSFDQTEPMKLVYQALLRGYDRKWARLHAAIE